MNTDRLQTLMGLGEAALVGVMDYVLHLGPDGVDYMAPTFWLGLALAASRAVKGYFAAGVKAVAPVLLLLVTVSACAALPTLSKVAPTICAYATTDEAKAAALALAAQMPEGQDKAQALAAINVADLSADAACTLVKALEAKRG